jgi:protein ImuB
VLWIALELPALPLQLVERAGRAREPLVVGEGGEQRPTVACLNAAARSAGIREGQSVASAKALAGELRVVARDPAAEREALERLAAWAGQFTPMVSVEAQGIALELETSMRLFGGHAKLTAAIRRGIGELGFRAVLGIAPTPLAARLFARAEARCLAVRGCLGESDLRARLSPLPLFLLDWPAETLARLADLGVLRLRDVFTLPPEGLARRFGSEVATSLDRLLGRCADPRIPYAPPPRFRSRLELPAEAEGVESLVFPLRRLLAEFEGTLRGQGAGTQRLTLTLVQQHGARTQIALEFASPEREADFILAIARERLSRLSLERPTIGLELCAEKLVPRPSRSLAWLPGEREQALDRERLIERLLARLGRDRAFGIALGDDHRPEKDWKAGSRDKQPLPARGAATDRPVWLLHRPQRLIAAEGRPTLQGALEMQAGPERIEAGWWDGEEVQRDYYVARNARGETFWIYREHRDLAAWYLHGVFA